MNKKINKLEKIDENEIYFENEIKPNKYNSYNQISLIDLISQFISKFVIILQTKMNNK